MISDLLCSILETVVSYPGVYGGMGHVKNLRCPARSLCPLRCIILASGILLGYPPVSGCFAGVDNGLVLLARALRVHASSSGELSSSLFTDGDDDDTVCKYTTDASSAVSGVLSLLLEGRARVVVLG